MRKQGFIIIAVLLFPIISFAHPGRTDSSGCHTCRTNCPDWGLSYGEYHCHNAKALPQPEEPIHSKYGAGGTGYTYPAPEYKAPAPAPTLNLNANANYNRNVPALQTETSNSDNDEDGIGSAVLWIAAIGGGMYGLKRLVSKK